MKHYHPTSHLPKFGPAVCAHCSCTIRGTQFRCVTDCSDLIAAKKNVSNHTVSNLIRDLFLVNHFCFVRHAKELMSIRKSTCRSLRNAVFYESQSRLNMDVKFALAKVKRPTPTMIATVVATTCILLSKGHTIMSHSVQC